mmetsp:Transcript_6798/g.12615  ORF Transcript_6798/g.12615 Transcript_6798/m.12615 type:complete len:208 (-) Transcript_6798:108-731(-)
MASQKSLSIHLSQLPFDISKAKIAAHLEEHGVKISEAHGVRFCYEKDSGDFTGVAFIDVVDEKSFKSALKLHRQRFGGRLINVRPTKTKNELVGIVAARDAKMLATGLEFKVSDSTVAATDHMKKRPRIGNPEEENDGTKKSRKYKGKTSVTEGLQNARNQPKPAPKPAQGDGNIESREKWSKSKRARMRAKAKKVGADTGTENKTS